MSQALRDPRWYDRRLAELRVALIRDFGYAERDWRVARAIDRLDELAGCIAELVIVERDPDR